MWLIYQGFPKIQTHQLGRVHRKLADGQRGAFNNFNIGHRAVHVRWQRTGVLSSTRGRCVCAVQQPLRKEVMERGVTNDVPWETNVLKTRLFKGYFKSHPLKLGTIDLQRAPNRNIQPLTLLLRSSHRRTTQKDSLLYVLWKIKHYLLYAIRVLSKAPAKAEPCPRLSALP